MEGSVGPGRATDLSRTLSPEAQSQGPVPPAAEQTWWKLRGYFYLEGERKWR